MGKEHNGDYLTDSFDVELRFETPVFVEEIYPGTLNYAYNQGYIKGLNCELVALPSARSRSSSSIAWNLEKYQSPETPFLVSELRGNKVYNLFKFVSISDGNAANTEVKVSITNLSFNNMTFDVLVRNFFDTTPFDTYPSEETRSITRFLNEELPSEIFTFRNQGLILLFNYIISETIESQNYLPWLNKTSFIDVAHTIRELLPLEVFQSDNQDFLAGYINEVKPYHVVVKDFLFKYTGVDTWAGDITDFDLPAQYNTNLQQYITPELVYANPSSDNQYVPTDEIWQDPAYTNWFNNVHVFISS